MLCKYCEEHMRYCGEYTRYEGLGQGEVHVYECIMCESTCLVREDEDGEKDITWEHGGK